MNRVVPELTDVHHIKLCYSTDTYCGHPRQCPIYNYGNGEIVVIHHHAPATYQTRESIRTVKPVTKAVRRSCSSDHTTTVRPGPTKTMW